MRFCPFCSAENADELAVCQACGRRLPPVPPRRARAAPGTGVQLPRRPGTTTQPPPRRAGATQPPPVGAALADASTLGPVPGGTASPGVLVTSVGGLPGPAAGLRGPAAPGPPPAAGASEGARALAQALSPGPAAQRREAAPAAPAAPPGAELRARRASDAPLPGGAPVRAIPSVLRSAPPALAAGESSPVERPSSPVERPSSPVERPSSPVERPSSPVERPSSPVERPSSPVERSSSPVERPSSPVERPNPHAAPDPPWATGYPRAPAGAGLDDHAAAAPLEIDATRARSATGVDPPPTRIHRPEALVDRPFTPPQVHAVPEIPEPGLINSARYAVRFARARWQRGGAIKLLGADIKKDTDALDHVLGALGGVARTANVDGRVFAGENTAITAAEQRGAQMTREHNELDARKLEESSRFIEVERERNAKLAEAERLVDEAHKEISQLEAQRKGLRDKRKELERRQKAYLKAAEDNDRQTGNADLGDNRQDLRREAEQHRREAAALEPERQEIDRRLGAFERPIGEVTARLDASKAELDAAKRSLADAREGHTHRLAELDAEQKRKVREIAQAAGEIARRLVTLGTLVNLNRVEDPRFAEFYGRIDRLRGAITARTTEIDRLTAERETYDRGNLVRGVAAIGGAIVLVIALIVILRAMVVG
jgi:hypothetical protein